MPAGRVYSPEQGGISVQVVGLVFFFHKDLALTRNVALFLGTYAFIDDVAANIRQKDDHVNEFAGGCAAGFLTGLRSACCT